MVETAGRITLWGIEAFVATAEEGSISAAAQRLGVSISGVSQQLTNLEAAVGASLIDRSTRPLKLTPSGRILRRRAQTILNEAALAQAELAADSLTALTRLRIGIVEDFEADITPRLLSSLSQELPDCHFLLETGASHGLADQLDARALDVIIGATQGDPPNWAESHPILRDPYVAIVPKGALDGVADTMAALAQMPLIQYTSRHVMGRQIAGHLAQEKIKLSPRFELDSYHAIMTFVAQGQGWTILSPLAVMHALRFAKDVDVVPLPMAPFSRTITLTARKDMLGDIPGMTADHLRGLLSKHLVAPAHKRMPWLVGQLTLL